MTIVTAGAGGSGLLPARPLAAQAHALRAAACFIEQAGIAGLHLTIDEGQITIQVPVCPAGRAAAVTLLAAAAGGQASRDTRPGRTRGWVFADGQIAGHHARIFTAIDPAGQEERETA